MPSQLGRPAACEVPRGASRGANGLVPAGVGVGRLGGHVAGMQRCRLLNATVELVAHDGVQAVTVASVCQRAGVSRKTFYDLFYDREACLLAAFEGAVAQAADVAIPAFRGQERWRVAVRAGLIALLSFLDAHPALARLLIVEALSSGPLVIERRAQVIEQLIAVVDEGRSEARSGKPPPLPLLTAEAVIGAVFSVIHARLLEATSNGRQSVRTARVLASIAEAPGASNKQIATAAEVSDEGQMSRLLNRLQHHGLIQNTGGEPTKGEAKAWILTNQGQGVLHAIQTN